MWETLTLVTLMNTLTFNTAYHCTLSNYRMCAHEPPLECIWLHPGAYTENKGRRQAIVGRSF